MSYGRRYSSYNSGGDRYGGRSNSYYQPSPWDSGRAPERYGDRYGSGGGSSRYSESRHSQIDPQTQLAAANAIISAFLTTQGGRSRDEAPFKRPRYDERFGRDRRDSYRGSSRGTFRSRGSSRSRGFRGSTRPIGRRDDAKGKEKDEKSDAEIKDKEEKSEGEEKEESNSDKKKEEWKEWKYRCHLCWKHMETEEEHLEHLKTEDHGTKLEERRARYRRQIQAIVFKLRRQEEIAEMKGARSRNFCTVCNVNFYGVAGRHNASPLHKDMRNLKQAYCRFCDVRFNDRIDYDKHILTIKHLKIRAKKLSQEDQLKPEDMEVLDSVGDEDDLEEDLEHPEEYDGEQPLGMQCVRKVVGYFCKLCCKFFTEEEQHLDAHCKGETHYVKFVDYAKTKLEEIAKKKEERAKEEAKKKEEAEAAAAAAKEAAEDGDENAEEEKEAAVEGDEEDEEMEATTEDVEMEETTEAEKAEETEETTEVEEEAAVVEEEEPVEEEVPTPKKAAGRGRGRGRGRKK